jgi:hypothetical protein
MTCVSRDTGITGKTAWVRTRFGIVFFGQNDMWRINPDGSGLENLSKSKIPDELKSMDSEPGTVTMGWNQDEDGVYLFLTPTSDPGEYWYFDFEDHGWWPMRFQTAHQPFAATQVDNEMVIASSDGTLRCFDTYTDDTQAIQSHVLIGPFRMGQTGSYGRMLSIHGALDSESGNVNWRLFSGETPEEVAEVAKRAIMLFDLGDTTGAVAQVKASGVFVGGRSHKVYPRTRGLWGILWLESDDVWAYEGITLELGQSGRWR